MKFPEQEFKAVAELIHQKCGILLDPTKGYLVKSRLAPLLIEYDCSNYLELCQKARGLSGQALINRIVDQISTNETSFFRDKKPFELLKNSILPAWERDTKLSRKLRIWSAACSTGQEVYSLAMTLKEVFGGRCSRQNMEIVASDVANSVLQRAEQGIYSNHEISRGLSPEQLQRYFSQNKESWRINQDLRDLTDFRKQNLFESFQNLGMFDVVFCRNVAIYFSMENRTKLFSRIADCLQPGGIMIIGSTESLFGICDQFTRLEENGAVYYRLKNKT